MSIEHPEDIAEMVVCRDCEDLVGWFRARRRGRPDEAILLQRGRCPEHRPRPHAPTWPGYDFNRGVDLCYCCGVEPLRSGSRWSVWFCAECKAQVGLLNGRHGRCIVPIGRHSVHWGWLLRAEDIDDPIRVQGFLDASKAAGAATIALADWQRIVIGLNLEGIGAHPERPTPVLEYWSAAASTVDRMERFRRMCAYLDARGRALVEGKERVSGATAAGGGAEDPRTRRGDEDRRRDA